MPKAIKNKKGTAIAVPLCVKYAHRKPNKGI